MQRRRVGQLWMGLRGAREKVVAMPALWAGVGLSVGGSGCAVHRVSVRDDRSNRNKSERQAANAHTPRPLLSGCSFG